MFTRQQIEEIRKGLALYSKKDTQFDVASLPINGSEEIAFVQNGKNVKMNLKELMNNLLLFRASDFINLSSILSNKFTLEEAIKAIPSIDRKVGVVITYIDKSIDDWVIFQYKSKSISDWFNLEYWKSILDEGKFKGYFANECLLYSICPAPQIGDYAFVGDTLGTAVIYRCINNAVWSVTDESALDYVKVIVAGDITVGENGNWFQNGVDTGIKAQGPKGDKGDSIKGDKGDTPVLRLYNGYIQYGYDGVNWNNLVPVSDFKVINSPDEEDITSVNDKLKLADKAYNATTFSGLGRKYLRKNITGGKNILTGNMISTPNTIYIIQYDFDLNGATLSVPANCVLQFEGGSISNGIIKGNETLIKAESDEIFAQNTNLAGSFENVDFYPEWFKYEDDPALSINKITNNPSLYNKRCVLRNKEYVVNATINLYSRVSLVGILGHNSTVIKSNSSNPIIEVLENNGSDFTIEHIRFDKNNKDGDIIDFGVEVGTFIINECRFLNVKEGYNAIYSDFDSPLNGLNYFKITKCKFTCNGNCMYILKGGDGVEVSDCNFSSIKGYNLYWVGVIGTANLKIDHNSFTGGGQYISINGCQQVLFSNNQCEIRNELLGANKYAIKFGELGTDQIAPMDNLMIINNNMNNVIKSASSFIFIDYVIGGMIIANGFANVEYAVTGGTHYSNITYISSRRELDSSVNKINDPRGLILIYNTGLKVVDLKDSAIKMRKVDAQQVPVKKAIRYNGNYYCVYDEDTNTYLDFNNDSLIKSGETTSRPTKNTSVGFKYFDTTLNKPISWDGAKWIDSNGNKALSTKGITSERPTLTTSDGGFTFYDSTLKKMILWNGTAWVNMDGTVLA